MQKQNKKTLWPVKAVTFTLVMAPSKNLKYLRHKWPEKKNAFIQSVHTFPTSRPSTPDYAGCTAHCLPKDQRSSKLYRLKGSYSRIHANKMAHTEVLSSEGSNVLLFPQIVKTIFQFLPAKSICKAARFVQRFVNRISMLVTDA